MFVFLELRDPWNGGPFPSASRLKMTESGMRLNRYDSAPWKAPPLCVEWSRALFSRDSSCLIWEGRYHPLRWPDSRETFQGSQTEPLFCCKSRFGALKNRKSRVWGDSCEQLELAEKCFVLRIVSRESPSKIIPWLDPNNLSTSFLCGCSLTRQKPFFWYPSYPYQLMSDSKTSNLSMFYRTSWRYF